MAQDSVIASDFLIIGCTSEIGSRLLQNLLSMGYRVDGIRYKSNCKVVSADHNCVSLNLFATDLDNLARTFHAKKVILVSWYTEHKAFWNSPLNTEWSRMYKQLCQAFINEGVEGFVGIGSCAEYSWSRPEKLSESAETLPASRYGREKLSLFRWLDERVRNLVWVRPFFVYGPNDHPDKLIQATISKWASQSTICIQNSQDMVDYVFVDDVALITSKLISINVNGVFNIGTGAPSSPVDVAQILGCNYELSVIESGAQVIQDSKFVVADNQRITAILGYIEWTRLTSGISKILDSKEI